MDAVTVVYDGGCGICIRFKRFVELFDRRERLEWQDLHDVDYDELPVTEKACLNAMQTIDDGTVYEGYEAESTLEQEHGDPVVRGLYREHNECI